MREIESETVRDVAVCCSVFVFAKSARERQRKRVYESLCAHETHTHTDVCDAHTHRCMSDTHTQIHKTHTHRDS